jgi:pimeloyl-ACP methyl ester carboxylesterase
MQPSGLGEPTVTDIADHVLVKLSRPKDAYALFADQADIAVVFVHGFLGNPRSTWIDFQHLIDRQQDRFPLWGKCDLFFYSYPSHDQIKPLAEDLLAFLKDEVLVVGLRAGPRAFDFPSGFALAPRIERKEPYKHLVFVGHSTGAVIIRHAVLEELRTLDESGQLELWNTAKDKSSSPLIVRALLRFFAPAHRGVLGAGWLGVTTKLPFLGLFSTVWLHSNPLFRSLSSGNPVLEDLKTTTERLHEKYSSIPSLTARSIFGSNEAVVIIGGYQHDKIDPTVPEQSHTSVCKPTFAYVKPLEFVTDALFGTAAGV